MSGSSDKTLKVWDTENGSEVLTLRGHERYVDSVAFSTDGRRIVSGSRDNRMKVWDAADPEEVAAEQLSEEEGASWIDRRIEINPRNANAYYGRGIA